MERPTWTLDTCVRLVCLRDPLYSNKGIWTHLVLKSFPWVVSWPVWLKVKWTAQFDAEELVVHLLTRGFSPCSSSARCLLLWTSSWRRWRASCRPASGTNSPASDLQPPPHRTRTRKPTSTQTETAELKPRMLHWTGLTRLCAKSSNQPANRPDDGRRSYRRQENTTTESRIGFDFIRYVCIFWGFRSFTAVLLLYKKRW